MKATNFLFWNLPFTIVASVTIAAPAAPTELSFEGALNSILAHSTDIKIRQTQVNVADIGVAAKKFSFLPSLSLSGSRGDGVAGTGQYISPTQSASLNADINLFRWGADFSDLDGLKSDLASEKEGLENTKLTVEEVGVESLVAEVESILEIEVLKKNAEAFSLYASIAKQRFDHGLLPIQEVEKVTLDLKNAEAKLQDAQSQWAASQANLLRLLGQKEVISKEWPWKAKLSKAGFDRLLSENPRFEERPDIKAAKAKVQAEESRRSSTYWAQYPSLNLGFTEGYSENEDGSNQLNNTNLSLSMPLFDRLSYYSKHKIQNENYAAADFKLRQLRLDAESQWTAAKDQFVIALKTANEREKSLDISQRLYHSNELRFKQGRANANDLEVDHTRLVEASLNAIRGWSSAHVQLSKLCHSLGRSVLHCD